MNLEREQIERWLTERMNNAFAISETKRGIDRDGWLEDEAYFKAAIRELLSAPAVSIERLDGEPRYVVLTFMAPNGNTGGLRVENVVATTMSGITEPAKAIVAWCEARKAEAAGK